MKDGAKPLPLGFGGVVAAWAAQEPTVTGLVLIGSRERDRADPVWGADEHSDWDFQIITSRPEMFQTPGWLPRLAGGPLNAYVSRVARIGGVPKVNLVGGGTEADFVIIPFPVLRRLRLAAALGRHRRPGGTRLALQDLAIVIRPGWRFLKDTGGWDKFYRRVVAEVPDPRIGDAAARQLADGFVCDYVGTLRKVARGELLAGQRLLHRELAETNLRLLHELKLRRGERTFPEGRRIERIASAAELASVAVAARFEADSLQAAIERSAATCRELMVALVGDAWRWPL